MFMVCDSNNAKSSNRHCSICCSSDCQISMVGGQLYYRIFLCISGSFLFTVPGIFRSSDRYVDVEESEFDGPGRIKIMIFSVVFLTMVISVLIIASINIIRETEFGKKYFPRFLLSWKWLPLACRSLEPYDKFCSCSCCGKQVRSSFFQLNP